jgi:hypothetical protein
MVSELAQADIAELEAQGIRLALQEIIRLNELGLRCERGARSADVAASPRIGWAASVPIHEPTSQVEEWMEDYAERFAADDDSYSAMLLFACAHAREQGFFDRSELHSPRGVREEIKRWKKTAVATKREFAVALHYAVYGDDPGADVVPVSSEKAGHEEPGLSALDEAISAGLGLSLAELRTLSTSRLYAIIGQHYRNAGFSDGKQADVRRHAEYVRTLAAIRAAHEKELTHG